MVNPPQAAFSGLKYIYITFNIYFYSIFPPKLRPPGLILVACLASRLYQSVFLSRLDLFLFAMTHCFLSCFCFLQWISNKHEHPGWKIHPLMKYMKQKQQQQQQSKCLVSPGIYKQAPCCRFSIIQELFFPSTLQPDLPALICLSVCQHLPAGGGAARTTESLFVQKRQRVPNPPTAKTAENTADIH